MHYYEANEDSPLLAPRGVKDPADRGNSFCLVTFALQQDAQCFEHIALIVS